MEIQQTWNWMQWFAESNKKKHPSEPRKQPRWDTSEALRHPWWHFLTLLSEGPCCTSKERSVMNKTSGTTLLCHCLSWRFLCWLARTDRFSSAADFHHWNREEAANECQGLQKCSGREASGSLSKTYRNHLKTSNRGLHLHGLFKRNQLQRLQRSLFLNCL